MGRRRNGAERVMSYAKAHCASLWSATGQRHLELQEIDYADILRERAGDQESQWDAIIRACQDLDSPLTEGALRELLEVCGNAERFSEFSHAASDSTAALLDVRDDAPFGEQRFAVLSGARDEQVVRCMEPMTARMFTAAHTQNFSIDHGRSEQHDHPVHRTNELLLARAPAHAPGNRQRVQGRRHDAGKKLRGGGPFLRRFKLEDATLGPLDLLQLLDRNATGGSKAKRGLRRST